MQHTANVSCNSTKRRMFASKSNLQINSDCGIIGEKVKPTDLCSTLLDAYPWDVEACMARDNEGSQFYLPPPTSNPQVKYLYSPTAEYHHTASIPLGVGS